MDTVSRWKPNDEGVAPPIPEFLLRKTATAGRRQPTPAALLPEKGLLL